MKPTRETRARGLARMATSLALSLAVVLSFGGSAAADDAKEEALPATPPAPPSVPSYGTTVKADGTPVAVVVSGGAGGKLSIVNLNTGESTAKDFDDGGADAQPWGFATLKDKTVLIGAGKGRRASRGMSRLRAGRTSYGISRLTRMIRLISRPRSPRNMGRAAMC